MQCLRCNSEDLRGEILIRKSLPVTRRRGSVAIAGVKVSQKELKTTWDYDGDDVRLIRGPILCADCGAEHFYVKGGADNKRLRMGSYEEAAMLGFEEVVETDFGATTAKEVRSAESSETQQDSQEAQEGSEPEPESEEGDEGSEHDAETENPGPEGE